MTTTPELPRDIHQSEKGTTNVSYLEALDRGCGPCPVEQTMVSINNLRINGFVNSVTGNTNFLGVSYARIPARFYEAKLINPHDEVGTIEAVKYGPCCPQPPDVIHDSTAYLYPKVMNAANSAEFSCLSVNIYTPPSIFASHKKLPVMAWIHGGAFTYGDASDEYDENYIVQHSISIGKPIIVVAFNYRVGYYGFLSSKELKAEAKSRGDNGFANLGFHDQRLALQWIQQNIGYFGGNGQEVTAAGESAGACSILTHLRSDFAAFQRAFIVSAAPIPLSPIHSQKQFDAMTAKLGLPPASPAGDKLAALRGLTCDEMDKLHGPGVTPLTYDPEFCTMLQPNERLEASTPFPSWVKGVVVGHTSEEAALFLPERVAGTEVVSMVKDTFGADTDLSHQILQTYNIKDDDTANSGTDTLIKLATHSTFGKIAHAIASEHTEVPVSYYSFEQRDPFSTSPWKGRAYHSLGNSMLFRLLTVAGPGADPGTKATADRFSEALIELTNGSQPWDPYLKRNRKMVFDGERSGVVQTDGKEVWSDLTATPEQSQRFGDGGLGMISDSMVKANS